MNVKVLRANGSGTHTDIAITSTAPVPRDAEGGPTPSPTRADLFMRMSGTSMATPIVAGACALIIQELRDAGQTWTPSDIKDRLLRDGVVVPDHPSDVVGAGRFDMSRL